MPPARRDSPEVRRAWVVAAIPLVVCLSARPAAAQTSTVVVTLSDGAPFVGEMVTATLTCTPEPAATGLVTNQRLLVEPATANPSDVVFPVGAAGVSVVNTPLTFEAPGTYQLTGLCNGAPAFSMTTLEVVVAAAPPSTTTTTTASTTTTSLAPTTSTTVNVSPLTSPIPNATTSPGPASVSGVGGSGQLPNTGGATDPLAILAVGVVALGSAIAFARPRRSQ